MDDDVDRNIDNYSLNELLTILNLPSVNILTASEINQTCEKIINKLNREKKYELVNFFEKARQKLLNLISSSPSQNQDEEEEEDEEEEGEDDEYDAAYNNDQEKISPIFPPQTNNPNEMNKYTNRDNTVKVENETSHFVMQQQRIGVIDSRPIPIIQGNLNPNLTNIVRRLVSIDSQYRQNILPYANGDINAPSYNTDYTLDLTDTLSKVTSLRLNSIQLPTTWYTFDYNLGNTCFLCDFSGITSIIDISAGNYKITDLIASLNTQLNNKGLTDIDISYNANTGKINFNNTSSTLSALLTFYQNGGNNICVTNSCIGGQKINQHLGWNLGFRREPDSSGNITVSLPPNSVTQADAIIDVYGPKYLLLVLDDYNNNHLNQSLVNISNTQNKLDIPTYYNSYTKNQKIPDSVVCVPVNLNNGETRNIAMLNKTFPRTLTQAQLYSTNEIIANRKATLNNRTFGPTNSDMFALIPLNGITSLRPDPYIVFSPTLIDSQRSYFGPVNIDRFRVRLLDDKGNLVNLNDNDWSFSLIVEQLYQY